MNHRISCPGKINLFLDVTGKTANGYHEILTLFLPVHGLEDSLSITESETISVSSNHPNVPEDSSNLCWKAAEMFAQAANLKTGWKITIDKKLPVAGGMGGGSSNAGRLLSLLQLSYPNKVSENKLAEMALKIGADVPFFLNPVPSLACGVGEVLSPLPVKNKLPILLITFSFPISAAWAYKNRTGSFNSSGLCREDVISSWESRNIEPLIYNDLGITVRKKFPIISNAIEDLKNFGAVNAIVSGSGPTVFGVFKDEATRDRALEELKNAGYPKENLITAFAG